MAAVAKRTVELFYDILSPYSWVAFEVLCRYRSKWDMDLKFCPFFLSGIMNSSGNMPPGLNPLKAAYMNKDLERLKDYYGIPINQPSDIVDKLMNKGSLSAMRLLTAANISHSELVEGMSREMWMRFWCRDENIYLPENLLEVCQKVGLSEAQSLALLSRTSDSDIKASLKATTQRALDLGAFGAPIIVAHKDGKEHMFFGS